jgi:hypothetical protein
VFTVVALLVVHPNTNIVIAPFYANGLSFFAVGGIFLLLSKCRFCPFINSYRVWQAKHHYVKSWFLPYLAISLGVSLYNGVLWYNQSSPVAPAMIEAGSVVFKYREKINSNIVVKIPDGIFSVTSRDLFYMLEEGDLVNVKVQKGRLGLNFLLGLQVVKNGYAQRL